MQFATFKSVRSLALATCATAALMGGGVAFAQNGETHEFEIAAQDLGDALAAFSVQGDVEVYWLTEEVAGKKTKGLNGSFTKQEAIKKLLGDAGVDYGIDENGTVLIGEADVRQAGLEQERGPFRVAQVVEGDDRDVEPVLERDDEDEEERDLIVVTGTNIRGMSPDSSPSFVFDRDDIDKTGFGTVSEFVQSLPQNFGGGSNADVLTTLPNDRASGQNLSSSSSVNIRGLGSGSTLVLLNGSRLAPSGAIGDFVDISMIPLSAVERVEVLTDGASAIYGADAIAGVVNFVLRSDYDGAESFVRFGSVTEGDLNEYRAGQTFGKSWNSGNALVSYEFYHRDSLMGSDREFASAAITLPRTLLPDQESHNVLLTASQRLTDRIAIRGHGTFSQRDSSNVSTSSSDGSSLFRDNSAKQLGGSIGADMELWGDWQLDLSGSYSEVSEFGDISGRFSQELDVDSDLWSIDGKIDGTLVRLIGGDLKIAAGLSYREESFLFARPDLGVIRSQNDRNVFGVYGEAFVPIVGADNRVKGVERLELTVAGRYDDYSDFGDDFNPKVGLLWSPLNGLNIRGTYSTSFNPPNLGDTGTSGFAFTSLQANPSAPGGTSVVIIDGRSNSTLGPETSTTWTAGFDSQATIGRGSLNVSLTWFDISYQDRIGVATFSFSDVLNNPLVFADVVSVNPDPALTSAIIAEANTQQGFFNFVGGAWAMPGDEDFILDTRLLNLSTADTSGLDINLTYDVYFDDFGELSFSLNSSYLFKQEKRITSSAPTIDVVNTVFNPVDFRLRGNVSWSRDGFTASTFLNHVNSYVDDRNILGMGDVPVDSWATLDVNLSFDTGESLQDSLLNNTRFSLSVLNLFSQDPPRIEGGPLTTSASGFDATNADPLGRFISFQITKAW